MGNIFAGSELAPTPAPSFIDPDELYPTDAARPFLSFMERSVKKKSFMDDFEIVQHINDGSWGSVWECKRRADGKLFAVKFFGYLKEPDKVFIDKEIGFMMTLQGVKGVIQIEEVYFDSQEGFLTGKCKSAGSKPMRKIFGAPSSSSSSSSLSSSSKKGCWPLMVMERVGRDVFTVIKDELEHNGRVIDLKDILALFGEIIIALKSIHDRGLLHRDLSINNIMLTDKGGFDQVKIIDFGLMEKLENINAVNLLGKPVGTPSSRAPEVCARGFYSEKSDVWGAGNILFTMLFTQYLDDVIPEEIEIPQSAFYKDGFKRRDGALPLKQYPQDELTETERHEHTLRMRNEGKDEETIARHLNILSKFRMEDNREFRLHQQRVHNFYRISDVDWGRLTFHKQRDIQYENDVYDLLSRLLNRNIEQRISLTDIAQHPLMVNINKYKQTLPSVYVRMVKRLVLVHKCKHLFEDQHQNYSSVDELADFYYSKVNKAKDGKITKEEFLIWLNISLPTSNKISENDVAEIFDFIDKEGGVGEERGDGFISLGEFINFVKIVMSQSSKMY